MRARVVPGHKYIHTLMLYCTGTVATLASDMVAKVWFGDGFSLKTRAELGPTGRPVVERFSVGPFWPAPRPAVVRVARGPW